MKINKYVYVQELFHLNPNAHKVDAGFLSDDTRQNEIIKSDEIRFHSKWYDWNALVMNINMRLTN